MKWALLALWVVCTSAAFAACPLGAPGNIAIQTYCPDYAYADRACANGPVSFEVVPFPTGGFPPAPYNPGYTIQPCDTVTWDFGDGTTETVIGLSRVTRDFPVPGNYKVQATVTNSLGTVKTSISTPRVIASSPSRLSFVTTNGYGCYDCVVASENSGAVTITVERSLDLSRTITAVATTYGQYAGAPTIPNVSMPLTFLPGETQKSFTIPIENDQGFYGPRFFSLHFAEATGGAFTFANTSWQPSLLILEDDPRPTLSITPEIRIREGNHGWTELSIPMHLSAPMLIACTADVLYREGTAMWDDFNGGYGFQMPAGQTSGMLAAGWVIGDNRPEADERYVVKIQPRSTVNDPNFGVTEAIVTIINDDAALLSRSSPPDVRRL